MREQVIITYAWWRVGENDVYPEHREELAEKAMSHIENMRGAGLTNGEMYQDIEGVEYNGVWDVEVKTLK